MDEVLVVVEGGGGVGILTSVVISAGNSKFEDRPEVHCIVESPSSEMSAVDVPPPPTNEPQTVTEEIVEGQVDTVDTKARYLAYVNRFRTIALASSRYLAYTSGTSIPDLQFRA